MGWRIAALLVFVSALPCAAADVPIVSAVGRIAAGADAAVKGAAAIIADETPKFSDTVDVVGAATPQSSGPTLAPVEAIASRELDQFVPSQGFQGAIRLLPAALPVAGGVSIKGGRASQAGVQLEMATLVDPASGVARVALPDDAIDSVSVLPNPYAVEYGRFSSGLVVIQSRRARDRGMFPNTTEFATVGTFTPTAASVNFHIFGKQVAVTERSLWTDRTIAETTFQWYQSRTDVEPQGTAPMELQPDTTLGNFFNRQHRLTGQYQVVEAVTAHRNGPGGAHVFKLGADILHAQYDGTSEGRTVRIERA